MHFTSVVLPPPEVPSTQTSSPGAMARFTWSSAGAVALAKRLDTLANSTAGIMAFLRVG